MACHCRSQAVFTSQGRGNPMAGRSLGLLLGKREGATRVKTGGTKDDRAPQRYCCDDCPAGGLVLHADVRFWCARRIQGIFGTKPRASCVMVPFMPAHMGMPFPRGADRFARRFRSLRARSQVSPGRPRDCGHVHMQGARSALSSAASDVDGRLSACRISQSRRAQPEIPRRRVGLTADEGSEARKCAGRKFAARFGRARFDGRHGALRGLLEGARGLLSSNPDGPAA